MSLSQIVEAEIVIADQEGVSERAVGKTLGYGQTYINTVLEKAKLPETDQLKKGLKRAMYEVSSLSTLELQRRLMTAPEKIQTPVLGVIAGIMAQRGLDLEKETQDKLSVDWGKLASELEPGMEQVNQQLQEGTTLPSESSGSLAVPVASPSFEQRMARVKVQKPVKVAAALAS